MQIKKEILGEAEISRSLKRISHEILEKNMDLGEIVLAGILTRGYPLAIRISDFIYKIENVKIPVEKIDISRYRDDIDRLQIEELASDNKIESDIKDKTVILVDDVLYTGRTIRAAMDLLIDLARPKRIQLAVLVDRGHRELPIRPDYVGKNLPTGSGEQVNVSLLETDGSDSVVIVEM